MITSIEDQEFADDTRHLLEDQINKVIHHLKEALKEHRREAHWEGSNHTRSAEETMRNVVHLEGLLVDWRSRTAEAVTGDAVHAF